MNGTVRSEESINIADKADEERKALGGPATGVDKGSENRRCRCVRGQNDERKYDGEETKDVKDKDNALKFGEPTADNGIYKYGEENDAPE